jgi:aldehyde dehydrogenase (NAD+)
MKENKKLEENKIEETIKINGKNLKEEITKEKLLEKNKIQEIPELTFYNIWDYSTSLEDNSYVKIKKRYDLFIGGKWISSNKYFNTINPATEEILSEIAYANEKEVDLAVNSAKEAYEKYWSKLKPTERAKYIFRIARLIQERSRELAIVETMDNGKPIRETRDFDIPQAAQHYFYYAGWADKLEYVIKNPRPIGVVGQIIPWNFPFLMLAWKIAPALATGNTIVIKPAELTPLSAMFLAEIIQDADLPPGVVNIINGDGYTGSLIVKHPLINKIAFTGSTEVGKLILKSIKGTNKKVTLELGGKGPLIILEDAPLDQAVEAVIKGIYFNQGHVCCASSRVLVQESILNEFIKKLKDRIKTIRIGNPLDKNTDMGAINSKMQLEKIKNYVQIGINEGANIYQLECKLPSKGYWYPPTFFTNVSQSNKIVQEEIFGPVLVILTFRDPKEAIEKANNTFYGLSAGVWTNNPSRLLELSRKIKAGVIWANTYNQFDPASPFGGYKESGFGREGGLHGLLPYLDI